MPNQFRLQMYKVLIQGFQMLPSEVAFGVQLPIALQNFYLCETPFIKTK